MKTCLLQLATCLILLSETSETSGPQLAARIKGGTRVVRGRDWEWDDQDGGAGQEGTVVRAIVDGWVQVEWDSGVANSYRMGYKDKYDLDLADSSSATLQLVSTAGTYTSDTLVNRTLLGPEIAALLKIGTRVVRGEDWDWADQDGGEGNEGEITAIDNDDQWVWVKWDLGGNETYRMGYNGKYDLKLAPKSDKRVDVTSSSSTTTVTPLTTRASISTTTAKTMTLTRIRTTTERPTSTSMTDNVQESNKLFAKLVETEISKVPKNYRIQVFQDILEVFKKFSR